MATLIEHAYSIIDQVKPRLNTDTNLSEDWVIKKIIDARNRIINEIGETGTDKLDDLFYQIIDYPAIVRRNTVEINNLSFEIDGDSYINIPKLVAGIRWKNIKYLGSVTINEKQTVFDRKSIDGYKSIVNAPYVHNFPIYTVLENRILLRNVPKGANYLTLIAIFEDPTKIADYVEETSDFPLPRTYSQKMEYIVKKEIFDKFNVPVDVINDRIDATERIVAPATEQGQAQIPQSQAKE